jgi:YVTN family beta-propeller protein
MLLLVLGVSALLGLAGSAVAFTTTNSITLASGSSAHSAAFSLDGTRAYVTDPDRNRVFVIDVATRAVTATISPSAPCGSAQTPRGIATTAERAFVAFSDSNPVCVIDQATNTYTGAIVIGDNTNTFPKLVVIDRAANRGYALAKHWRLGNSGSVTAFSTNPPYTTRGPVASIAGAEGLALSVDGSELYVSTAEGEGIKVIDTTTMTITRTILQDGIQGGNLVSMVADPRGGHLIVLNQTGSVPNSTNANRVDIVNIASGQVVGSAPLTPPGGSPSTGVYEYNEIAVSPDGRTAYVADWPSQYVFEISVVDPANPQLLGAPTALRTRGIAVSPDGARVYAGNGYNAEAVVFGMAVPGAPAAPQATAGTENAGVSWTAPASDGGAPILAYTVTAVEDPTKSCTTTATLPAAPARSCTVTGLTPGATYSFTVTARNGVGTGPASAATSPVTIPTAGSSGSSNAAATSGPAAAAPAVRSALRVVSTGQAGSGIVLRLRVSGAGRLTVDGTVSSTRDSNDRTRVCRGARPTARSGAVLITCRLNATGRSLLAVAPLRIQLGIVFEPTSGTTRTATRTVRLARVGGLPESVTG